MRRKTYALVSAAGLLLAAILLAAWRSAGMGSLACRGDTLRSMLLNAYAFWQMGEIALVASIVSYIGAGLLLVLSIFGFAHLRRAAPEAEILPRVATRVAANAS